jgi:hypothetical protein
MAPVTISKFNNVRDAELARMALEVEGIPAFLIDAYTGQMLGPTTTGGVRLQVDESDVDKADAVLNRIAGVIDAEYVAPSDAGPWEPPRTCPNCGAAEVVRRQKWIGFAVVAAFVAAISYVQDATLLGFFIIATIAVAVLVAASWRCRSCGHTW